MLQIADEDGVRGQIQQRGLLAQLLLVAPPIAAAANQLHRATHRRAEAGEIILRHMVGGPATQHLGHGLHVHRAGEQDERNLRTSFARQRQRRQPVEARQLMIGEYDIKPPPIECRCKFSSIAGARDRAAQPVRDQHRLDEFRVEAIVLQMKNAAGRVHIEKLAITPRLKAISPRQATVAAPRSRGRTRWSCRRNSPRPAADISCGTDHGRNWSA